jgi:hypothetical protein
MASKYSKAFQNIPRPSKIYQIVIFGTKLCHQATLPSANKKEEKKLTIMSNLFSSSLTPNTIVIVCPILMMPDTSLA